MARQYPYCWDTPPLYGIKSQTNASGALVVAGCEVTGGVRIVVCGGSKVALGAGVPRRDGFGAD